jgi:hypothetical protein
MRRLLFLIAAASSCLFAQLQIFTYDGASEKTVPAITDLSPVAMGDSAETRFRARNNSNAGIALQSLSIAGQSFSLSDKPTLPYIVAPANFAEFRVTFKPSAPGSYSATLTVNGAAYILRASSSAAPVVSVKSDGPASVIAAGSPIDFGRILKNTSASRTIRLANATAQVLTVNAVSLTGAAFHGPAGATFPARIPANDAVEFQITFDPKASGVQAGALKIDDRSFPLAGTGFDPPFPKPTVSIDGPAQSGTQPKLSIQFDQVPQLSGSGTLTLDFKSSVAGASDDPAIVFVNTGSRRLTFQVTEGNAAAAFGALKEVPLQTGTTAGTITLTVQLADYTGSTTINIAPAPVKIDSSAVNRRASDLDVTLTAFDNTRTSGKFKFTFFDRSGAAVQPGAITVDATADFGRYFAISRVGGSFLTRVTFPVTGDATQIAGVEVEVINSAGSVRTQRLSF